ncbi:MAG: hypothetical protein ACRBFS_17110 [Aureispira sp.]
MPVQGKSIPRYGSSSSYEANVNPAFFGLASMAIPAIAGVAKKLLS